MKIKNISILGLGLIGGSIAKALKKTGSEFSISAFDKDEILDTAIKDGVIDHKLVSFEDSLSNDLIFICLPVDLTIDVFETLAPKLNEGTILTDVCSVKYIYQEKWEKIESKGYYFGGHPMTGKEDGGYENSDPLLFENSVYIVTEDLNQPGIYQEFRKVIEMLGSNILHIPAKQHDVIAASVSHLPQLLSVALVNTASLKTDNYNFLDLAAGGFRDMTRIAASDFKIWESIISTNNNQILTALDKFSYEIDILKEWILKNKTSELADYFEKARKNRDEIPKNTKGFMTPLHDIFIFVVDQPGMVSKISTALYEQKINIKDIELLKIRAGTGGTFRLSFDSAEDAATANKIVKDLGFETK